MIFLKKASSEDIEKEWLFVRDMPEDENGLCNSWHGVSREDFEHKALPSMLKFAEGKDLPEGYVPETFFFLWQDDEIVGQFRIRHYLCESLRTGAGHIGYFIAKPFRGRGLGTEGLRLTLEEARLLVPEEEIYLRVNRDNPASLHVMLNNGGRIVGQDEAHFFVRIPNRGKGIIARFVSRSVEILKEKLTGIYLHGSAAMGCYQPEKSDLDLMVVVREAMTETEKRAYMEMVVALDAECPGKGIEMSVVTADICNPFVYPTPFILHYSRMHTAWYRRDPEDYIRKMNGTDRDLAAHFTVIRSRGICLYGRPVCEVFGEVPEADYLDAIREDVSGAEEEIADNPMYLILNLTRVLAYLREKKVLSKREGGRWGLEYLPEKYHPLIRTALDEYENGADVQYDIGLAREYAGEMLKNAEKVTIREIEEKDYLPVAEIWREVLDIPTATDSIVSETYEKMKADNRYRTFVAETDGKVVGLAATAFVLAIGHPNGYIKMNGLGVLPEYQHQGIGRLLMNRVERLAKESGALYIGLASGIRRTEAHAFYEHLGYQKTSCWFRKDLNDRV